MLLVFLFSFLLQGLSALTAEDSSITGTLRTADGEPAAGIRIAAVVPAAPGEESAVMASIAETDAAGGFQLDGVPPGRYYIAAGRVDSPTYYPGVLAMEEATLVAVTPGTTASGIDFALAEASSGRAATPDALSGAAITFLRAAFLSLRPDGLTIPLSVQVENGGKIAIRETGLVPSLRLTPMAGGDPIRIPLSPAVNTVLVPFPAGSAPDRYRIDIENLPDGYQIRSMAFGGADVVNGELHVSRDLSSAFSGVFAGSINRPPNSRTTSGLTVILTAPPPAPSVNGVRVTGWYSGSAASIYLSGIPATLYTDGTFEIRDVPPGRHAIVKVDEAPPGSGWYLSLVVGDSDIEGITLLPASILPIDVRTPRPPQPAAGNPPGAAFAPVSLRGQILGPEGNSINLATVILTGYSGARRAYTLSRSGGFEIPRLMPGVYEMEVAANGYARHAQTVVIGDEPAELRVVLSRP